MLLTLDAIMSPTVLMILKDKLLNAAPKPNINHCPVELQAWAVEVIQFTLKILFLL